MADLHLPGPWLPDLCRWPRVAAMAGLAELVVVVVVLVPAGGASWTPARLLSASGLALWLALVVTALLCLLREPLSRLPQRLGAATAIALAGAVAWTGAAVVHALFTAARAGGPLAGFWSFSLGSAATTALMTALALRYFYVSDRWSAQTQANARAEADALQARIRPHFLFNSMNLIAGLLPGEPALAERAVLDLSDLFRAALGAGGDSSLREECELAERYLSIESLRLGTRLQVQWQRREPLPWALSMPRLVLQPLVENAVLHGISRLAEGGCVRLSLGVAGDVLEIDIVNPAPDPGAPGPLRPGQEGAGHAQRSIAHRLAFRFGPRARMTGGWRDGYYACGIRLPLPQAGGVDGENAG